LQFQRFIMLKLYYAQKTCSLASHIALEDAGAEFSIHRLNIAANEHHAPEYLAINPKARVPTLLTPSGILTETPAMLAYIAQTFPQAALAPLNDPYAFAKIQELNSYLASTLHVAHAHRMRGNRWADDENAILAMKKKVPETVSACFAYIESEFLPGPFAVGDSYSIADPYLFTVATWMESDGVDPSPFPKVSAHREMMRARATVQKALHDQFAD
jgi:glutathione S-transferase